MTRCEGARRCDSRSSRTHRCPSFKAFLRRLGAPAALRKRPVDCANSSTRPPGVNAAASQVTETVSNPRFGPRSESVFARETAGILREICRERVDGRINHPQATGVAKAARGAKRVVRRARIGRLALIVAIEIVARPLVRLSQATKPFERFVEADHDSLPDRAVVLGFRARARFVRELVVIGFRFRLELVSEWALTQGDGAGTSRARCGNALLRFPPIPLDSPAESYEPMSFLPIVAMSGKEDSSKESSVQARAAGGICRRTQCKHQEGRR